jgi:hypothetical protein
MCQTGDEEDAAVFQITGVLTSHGTEHCRKKDENVATSSKGSVDGCSGQLFQLEVGRIPQDNFREEERKSDYDLHQPQKKNANQCPA